MLYAKILTDERIDNRYGSDCERSTRKKNGSFNKFLRMFLRMFQIASLLSFLGTVPSQLSVSTTEHQKVRCYDMQRARLEAGRTAIANLTQSGHPSPFTHHAHIQ